MAATIYIYIYIYYMVVSVTRGFMFYAFIRQIIYIYGYREKSTDGSFKRNIRIALTKAG